MKRAVLSVMRARALQPFWMKLGHLSLIGRNFWATTVEDSGEVALLRKLSSQIRGGVIFDIGANIGQFATAARDILQPSKLYSFEPSANAFAALSRLDGIIPVPLALSDSSGVLTLHTAEAGASIGSLLPLRNPIRPFTGENDEQVRVTTLDEFCAREGVERIDFLKIDVEGAELAVLKGATGMLERKSIRFIQFEFGDGHIDARTYLRDFFDLLDGYDIFRIIPSGLIPLPVYSPEFEVFAPINYLAQLRDWRR